MNSPLRLIVELKPLQPSVPDTLSSITLRYDELTCSSGILTTATTLSEKEINELCWYLEEYWQWSYEQFKERTKKIESALAPIGKRLYYAVFDIAEAQQLVQWDLQSDGARSRMLSWAYLLETNNSFVGSQSYLFMKRYSWTNNLARELR